MSEFDKNAPTPRTRALDQEIHADPNVQPSAKQQKYRRLCKELERELAEVVAVCDVEIKRRMALETALRLTQPTCTHGVVGYCETCALRDPGELGEFKPRLVTSSAELTLAMIEAGAAAAFLEHQDNCGTWDDIARVCYRAMRAASAPSSEHTNAAPQGSPVAGNGRNGERAHSTVGAVHPDADSESPLPRGRRRVDRGDGSDNVAVGPADAASSSELRCDVCGAEPGRCMTPTICQQERDSRRASVSHEQQSFDEWWYRDGHFGPLDSHKEIARTAWKAARETSSAIRGSDDA